MQVFETVAEAKAAFRALRRSDRELGFVPTMGALHEGHLSLVAAARAAGAEAVAVSIFVNPLQFDRAEDLEKYPRDREADLRMLEGAGCDLVFYPTPEAMYPAGHQTRVEVTEVTKGLCGAHRPGHFTGVATVVTKLLNIVGPDLAVFGEKDFQQLALIRTLVRDLDMDVRIVGGPLVRDPDGLALSSRNRRLSADQRVQALALYRGLSAAKAAHAEGERDVQRLLQIARAPIEAEPGVGLEYLELRRFEDLGPVTDASKPCVLLVAAQVGPVRLIDNLALVRA